MSGSSSLDVLLEGIFDYAGMFPPASLSLSEMLVEASMFAQILNRPSMVGSTLVLPIEQASSLSSAVLESHGFARGSELLVCVLGGRFEDKAEAISEARLAELSTLQAVNDRGLGEPIRYHAGSYEISVTRELLADSAILRTALRNMKAFLQEERLMVCLEPDLSSDEWVESLQHAARLLAELNRHARGPDFGLKVRCSGAAGIDAARLAAVVDFAAQHNLGLKATAGLHHPIIESTYGNSLGFLSLAVAVMLRRALGPAEFSSREIARCLLSDSADAFRFGGEQLGWDRFNIGIEELRRVKGQRHFSVGSCSLTEPDADLVRLFGKNS